MRLRALAAVVLVTAAATSGCTAKVDTAFTVTGADTATVVVSADFTGEAGQVLAEDAASRQGLIDLFTRKAGTRPQVDVDGDHVRATVAVDYDQLAGLADITGVQAARLTEAGTRTTLSLVAPRKLAAAITAQVADQPDAGPLAQTMLEATKVSVTVHYPGGVEDATFTPAGGTAAAVPVDGDTATLTRTADDQRTGELAVHGDPTATVWWPWLVGATLLAGVGGVAATRRRR